MQKNTLTFQISDEKSLDKIAFSLEKWDKIFFYGDLGAGKTTFIRALLRQHFHDENIIVRSPTYTYYQEYFQENFEKIFHFDLYRLDDLENFFLIWWDEILQNPDSIALIEWPEILQNSIRPTKIVKIHYNPETNIREIIIENC